jgi:hypothetical protein
MRYWQPRPGATKLVQLPLLKNYLRAHIGFGPPAMISRPKRNVVYIHGSNVDHIRHSTEGDIRFGGYKYNSLRSGSENRFQALGKLGMTDLDGINPQSSMGQGLDDD